MNHYNEFQKVNPMIKNEVLFTLTGDYRATETLCGWSGRTWEEWNDAWGELFILMSETLKNTGD